MQHDANSSARPEQPPDSTFCIKRVGIRVPPFWPEKPAVWFAQLEGQFALSNITQDATKFYYVISQLENKYPAEVEDVITNLPPTGRYVRIKVPLHVGVWLASPAGLGFQLVKLARVWSVTSRTWPSLVWLVRAFGGARLAAGLLLARTCVEGPKPDSRIHTVTNTDSASFVTKEEPCRLPCLKHS